jgi:exopolysaccharide biosynthesis protein
MNQRFLQIIFLFSVSLCLCGEGIFAQDFTQIADGIEHAKFTRKIKDEPVNVNLLKLDLNKVRLDVVHALDAAVGLETTSSIATRHGAFAAINAGFFKMTGVYNGDAAGVLQIDGKLLSESYGNRIALGIFNGKDKTEINFGHVIVNWEGGYVDSAIIFSGVNRERKPDEVILYTPEFHRTTLTDSTGTEIILSNCSPRCKQIEVVENKGSSLIPSNGYVISIGKDAKEKAKYVLPNPRKKTKKKTVKISLPPYDELLLYPHLDLVELNKEPFFEKAEDIVGGVPQLIKNGKIEITWEQEKIGKEFVETRHPRTAVAKLKDGKFLLITVDGRQPNVSVGMSLQELAEMLLEFGAVDAMNLDGGGSTTMFVKDKVVNQTSDKTGERPVSDAILVTLRK